VARSLSSSLFFGMPSTLQGYPLELQVYEYLLNGYFGAKEMPISKRMALDLSKPFLTPTKRRMLLDPETHIPGYNELPKPVQNELQIQAQFEFGGSLGEFSNTQLAFAKAFEDAKQELDKLHADGKITD